MEIKRNKNLNNIIWYCSDNSALYVLYSGDSDFQLATVDPGSLQPVKQSAVRYHPNPISYPVVDEDLIFLPAVDGRVIGIDKYSYDQVVDVDLGPMMAKTPPVCDHENIYTVCSVPISNKHKTDVDVSVVCINDKKTGEKKGQTCVLIGKTSPLAVSDGNIFVSNDKVLNKFSDRGEQLKSVEISFTLAYPPIVHESSVFALSSFGAIEIFDQQLKSKGRLMAGRNQCQYVCKGNKVYWPLGNQLVRLNLNTEQLEKLGRLSYNPLGKAVATQTKVYFSTTQGHIVEFDSNNTERSIYLTEGLRNPHVVENNLIVASNKELFQCLIMP